MMSYIYPLLQNNLTRYKVYFVHEAKKIYLGLYDTLEYAENALQEAQDIMHRPKGVTPFHYHFIDFKKFICLCNFRDYGIYIKNPIYVYNTFFHYYLSKDLFLTFDAKDLLFFSTYKITKRGNYLYTQDNVTQQSILSRFGIPPHSILGTDYRHKNGDCYDFRRENLEIINTYKGVSLTQKNNKLVYTAKIFIHHTIVIGHYASEIEAAIAYNKAIDMLIRNGSDKNYIKNTIPYLTLSEYNQIYDTLQISPCIKTPSRHKRVVSTKKYRGICKDKSGYRASIGYKGKQIYLGIYPTEKRAAQAYNYASFYLYGNNGHINSTNPLIYDHDSKQIVKHLTKYNILKTSTKAPHTP